MMLFNWWPLGVGGGVVQCSKVLCLGLLHVGQMNAEVFGRKDVETSVTTPPSNTAPHPPKHCCGNCKSCFPH
jgi:hypothetical protein